MSLMSVRCCLANVSYGWSDVQEWPQEVYPPYANGPGYVITSDIAKFIISQHVNRRLRVCNSGTLYIFSSFWTGGLEMR